MCFTVLFVGWLRECGHCLSFTGRPTSSVQTLLSCIVSVLSGTGTVSNIDLMVRRDTKSALSSSWSFCMSL